MNMSIAEEIKALEATLARLKAEQESERPVKWEPKGGYWQVDCEGDVVAVDSFSHQKEFGTKRITREQAERASVQMRRFNRLLALRDELCGDDVVDWGIKTEKFVIYHNHQQGQWKWARYETRQDVTVHFSDVESAHEACRMLNSGEVEL